MLPPAGVELDFAAEASLVALVVPLATRQALCYIYKEALHNVLKHAKARQVRVRLRVQHAQLALEVLDDGLGMAGVGRPGGQGLANMRQRILTVGGAIAFEAAQPGTRLVVRLPLR